MCCDGAGSCPDRNIPKNTVSGLSPGWDCWSQSQMLASQFRFRFKLALLLPIEHSIIYITVISAWNINTSTNTAMPYHGSKGAGNPVGLMGSLSVSHIASIFQQGCKGCNRKTKKSNTKWQYNYLYINKTCGTWHESKCLTQIKFERHIWFAAWTGRVDEISHDEFTCLKIMYISVEQDPPILTTEIWDYEMEKCLCLQSHMGVKVPWCLYWCLTFTVISIPNLLM